MKDVPMQLSSLKITIFLTILSLSSPELAAGNPAGAGDAEPQSKAEKEKPRHFDWKSIDGVYNVGPTFSYVNGKSSGWAAGLDLSYLFLFVEQPDPRKGRQGSAFPSSISLHLQAMNENDNLRYGAHLEAVFALGILIGGSGGYMFGSQEHGINWAFFTALPIPTTRSLSLGPLHSLVFLPYYRLNWFAGRRIHEAGIQIKLSTWK